MNRYGKYLTLVSSAALPQAFLLLISPIITRLYGPEDVGAFAMILGVSALIGTVATARLEHVIPVVKSTWMAVQVTILGGALATTVVVLVSCGLAAAYSVGLLDTFPSLQHFPLLAIPAIAFSLAIFQLMTALLLRLRLYRHVGVMRMSQGMVLGFAQLALGWLTAGASGLVVAQLLGYLVGAASGMRVAVPRILSSARARGVYLCAVLGRYRKYALLLAPAAVLNQAAQQLPVVALGYFHGLYAAGLFALVMRVCAAPLSLLGQAVAQVYASEFRSYLEGGGELLARKYLKMLVRLLMLGAAAVSVLVLILNLWGAALFGERWADIGTVSFLLVPMLLLDFVVTPLSMTLGYLGHGRIQFVWDMARLIVVAGVFVVANHLTFSFGKVTLLLSLTWAIFMLGHAVLTYAMCRSVQASTIR